MTFWREDEDSGKLWVTIEGANALDNVPVEHLEGFSSDNNLTADEAGATRGELFINDHVQLTRVLEGKTKKRDKL